MNFYEQIAAWQVWSQVFCPRRERPSFHRLEGTPRRLHRRIGRSRWAPNQLRSARRLDTPVFLREDGLHHPTVRRHARRFWSAFATGDFAYAA